MVSARHTKLGAIQISGSWDIGYMGHQIIFFSFFLRLYFRPMQNIYGGMHWSVISLEVCSWPTANPIAKSWYQVGLYQRSVAYTVDSPCTCCTTIT